tara:strand:- start:626 stop:751 length:126 start_codon:yes stop_codon:yes gene_type:complete
VIEAKLDEIWKNVPGNLFVPHHMENTSGAYLGYFKAIWGLA